MFVLESAYTSLLSQTWMKRTFLYILLSFYTFYTFYGGTLLSFNFLGKLPFPSFPIRSESLHQRQEATQVQADPGFSQSLDGYDMLILWLVVYKP